MATQHTPTPWQVSSIYGYGVSIDAAGKYIGNTDSADVSKVERKANAKFIVLAVNSHDDLLEACDEAYLLLADWNPNSAARIMRAIKKARPDAANNAS